MQTYANNGGNSGIFGYENGDAFIIVEFEEYLYKYSHVKPGKTHVEKMKELAQVGQGIASSAWRLAGKPAWTK